MVCRGICVFQRENSGSDTGGTTHTGECKLKEYTIRHVFVLFGCQTHRTHRRQEAEGKVIRKIWYKGKLVQTGAQRGLGECCVKATRDTACKLAPQVPTWTT